MDGNQRVTTENINEVILRLLKLKSGMEMDYQTYFSIIKKKLTIHAVFAGNKLPQEEQDLLIDELNRIRKIKDKEQKRFKIKEKKIKVSMPSPGRPPSGGPSGGGGGTPPKTGAIVKSKSGKITADNYFYQNYVEPVNVKDVTKKTAKVSKQTDPLIRISNTLDSILETLTNINNFDREQANRGRRDAENRRRGQRESELESKSFEGIKKALSAITKPFQSIWDKIVNFITNVILGRIVIKLINWIADPGNQGKIQSIIRFLGDHWPTLLALYLRFGTGIGRFVGKLTRSLVKGSAKLIKLTAELAAKIGLKRAGKLASFLGGPKGRAIATGVGIAADVAITAGTAFGASKLFGGEKQEPVSPEPVQEFSGGGAVRIPKFAGGGFANFGNMFKGAGFGSMFGPLGMLAGAALGSGKPQEMFSGLIKGPGGPKEDKIPLLASNGEFIMSAGAVKKYGVDTLEAMNAAGGGTNIPKIANGIVHAAGGGMIGDINPYNPNQMSEIDFRTYVDGRIEEKMADRRIAELRGSRSSNLPKLNTPRTSIKTLPTNRMLPAAGQSSANAMRAAERSASRIRPPIPASSAIVPYTGGGLVRTGMTGGLSAPPVQRINTNMNVPGGRIRGGSLSAIMMALEMKQRKDEGQTNVQAGLGAGGAALGGQLGWMAGAKAGALAGAALGSIVPGLGTGVGAAVGAIVGGLAAGYGGAMLGGNLADNLTGVNAAKERASRGGIGGAVKGGYGLKGQSFKDAPKTMVMTDDKGRPFVGHKAMKNGKLTYVRPSKPGTGTTNPLEMLGRFINPGAYKDSDSKVAMKNQKIAMVNALESFQKQGMAPDAQARMMKQMGGNLKDVQNDLNYRKKRGDLIKQGKLKSDGTSYTSRERMRMSISRSQTKNPAPKPLPKPKPKPQIAGGGMGERRGGGSSSSSGSKAPSHSAKHSKESVSKSVFGIMATGR
jgi:hypothetical protein